MSRADNLREAAMAEDWPMPKWTNAPKTPAATATTTSTHTPSYTCITINNTKPPYHTATH